MVGEARAAFRAQFGRDPVWVSRAPGRVNLIGEHTDYNGGYVLPMAIDKQAVVAGAPAPAERGARLRVRSLAVSELVEIDLGTPLAPGEPGWANYVRGVVAGFQQRGASIPGLDLVVASDVPLGGGLSSSAALEVATATLLEAALQMPLEPVEKARLCRWAEHHFAGVPCGLMDQLTSVLGDPSGALLIDCQAEVARVVPFAGDDTAILVCNTNVRHALGDGAYARRRAECDEAAAILNVAALRDATVDMVTAARDRLGPVRFRRARHVVTENARTLEAAAALSTGDFGRAGVLMFESHASLRDDFEVSCAELDAVVEVAQEIGVDGGLFGARMTGGGFGGCAVVLARAERLAALTEMLCRGYERRTGRSLTPFRARPSRGAHLLSGAEAGAGVGDVGRSRAT